MNHFTPPKAQIDYQKKRRKQRVIVREKEPPPFDRHPAVYSNRSHEDLVNKYLNNQNG